MSGETDATQRPVLLDEGGYRALCRTTVTHREHLVVRLGGELGLRPFEMVEIRPRDVRARVTGGETHYFLRVGADDDARDVYLPADVKRHLERYVRSNDIDGGDRVLDVTPRRIQMLVSLISDRTADLTDRDAIAEASSGDLRQYFAHHLLADRGIDAGVVMAIGGWKRFESLAHHIEEPTIDEIAAAFAGTDDDQRLEPVFNALGDAIVLLDANGIVEYVNRRFETVVGTTASEARGQPLENLVEELPFVVWETATAGEVWTGELAYCRENRPPVRGMGALVAITGTDGTAERFVATFIPGEADDSHVSGSVRTDQALTELEQVHSAIRAVSEGLSEASTREEIRQVVCERLATSEAYDFAWISDPPTNETVIPQTWVGVDEGTIEQLTLADGGETTGPLTNRAIQTQDVQTTVVTANPRGEDDNPSSRQWTVTVAPLVHETTVYGALSVATSEPSHGQHEAVLASLGERVGHALAAVEWKRLLLGDTKLVLEFRSTDPGSFFVAASEQLGCTLRLDGLVLVEQESLLHYVTVEGAQSSRALEFVTDTIGDGRLIAEYSDESLLEVVPPEASLAVTLTGRGGSVQKLVAEDGEARIVCGFAADTDVRSIVDDLTATFPASELVGKREFERPVHTTIEFQQELVEQLAPKQLSALEAAYHSGYFQWPRKSTAEELADSVGVSSPTLHHNLRRAQQKLLSSLFDESRE